MSVARRLWALRHDRPLLVVVSVATVLATVLWPLADAALRPTGLIHVSDYGFNDFGVYSGTVNAWLDGEPIYVQNEDGGYHGSFLYPPFVLPLFYPFSMLGFEAGPVLLGTLSLFLLWVGIDGIAESYGARLAVPERIVLLFALFGFHPAFWDFKWAQVSTLLAAVLCFAFLAHQRGERLDAGDIDTVDVDAGDTDQVNVDAGDTDQVNVDAGDTDQANVDAGDTDQADVDAGDADTVGAGDASSGAAGAVLSGVLTTVGTTVKLFYMTAGAHLLRDGRRLAGAVASGAVLLGGSLLVFGLDTHLAYLDVLTWGKGWGTEQLPPAKWQTAYFRPFYLVDQFVETIGISVPNSWIIAATVLGVLGVIALSLAARHSPAAAQPTFALGVAVVPLLAPRAYTHDLVVLLLPALVLLAVELDREDGLAWLPVFAVLLLHFHTPGTKLVNEVLGASDAVFIQPGVYGTAILVGLAAVRVAEHARLPGERAG